MGGGGGGGSVVQYTDPTAAYGAGYLNSQAALVAGQQASNAVNDAINSINRQYQQARYDVQPYRTTGVQALNQLNQYLGLDAYNPGAAPVAPKANTLENALNKITTADVKAQILGNASPTVNDYGQFFNNWQYTGEGAADVAKARAATDAQYDPTTGAFTTNSPGGSSANGEAGPVGRLTGFLNDPTIADAVKQQLAKDYMAQNQEAYDIANQAYTRDLDEYNQNLAMYNKYSAEGPLTTAQVSDKITNLPGYQAQLGQGIDAIQKASSAGGYLGSGRLLKELNSYGQNTLSTFYNNELSRLASLAGGGQQAAQATAANSQAQGNALAGMQNTLGEVKANSSLSSANALSQALIAANQQYKTVGGGGGGGGLAGIGSLLGGISSFL